MSNGDLHIRDVTSDDSHRPLRCTTYNTLTNDTRTSGQAMLYVIGTLSTHYTSLITSANEDIMFSSLFVRLSVSNFAQKLPNGFA